MTATCMTIKNHKFIPFYCHEISKRNSVFGQFSLDFPFPKPFQNAEVVDIVISATSVRDFQVFPAFFFAASFLEKCRKYFLCLQTEPDKSQKSWRSGYRFVRDKSSQKKGKYPSRNPFHQEREGARLPNGRRAISLCQAGWRPPKLFMLSRLVVPQALTGPT